MLDKLDYIAAASGVLAVSIDVHGDDGEVAKSGCSFTGSWGRVLAQAIALRAVAGEDSISIVTGQHTVIVQKHGASVAAVAFQTGDPVAKSIRRMLRMAAGIHRPKRPSPAKPTRGDDAKPAVEPTDPASIPDEVLPSSIPW